MVTKAEGRTAWVVDGRQPGAVHVCRSVERIRRAQRARRSAPYCNSHPVLYQTAVAPCYSIRMLNGPIPANRFTMNKTQLA